MAAYGINEDWGWFGKEIERVVVYTFYRPSGQVGVNGAFYWDVIGYSKFYTLQDVFYLEVRELNHGSSVIAESKYLIVRC